MSLIFIIPNGERLKMDLWMRSILENKRFRFVLMIVILAGWQWSRATVKKKIQIGPDIVVMYAPRYRDYMFGPPNQDPRISYHFEDDKVVSVFENWADGTRRTTFYFYSDKGWKKSVKIWEADNSYTSYQESGTY